MRRQLQKTNINVRAHEIPAQEIILFNRIFETAYVTYYLYYKHI